MEERVEKRIQKRGSESMGAEVKGNKTIGSVKRDGEEKEM